MNANGRAVLVTGGSSGIGEATARHLAARGFRAFATVRKDEDYRRLAEDGMEPIRLDVTDAVSIAAARTDVENRLSGQPLLGLVNNAGVPGAGPLELIPLDELRRVLEVNVVGAIAVTQAFLPLLERPGGRIVMMSSVSGRIAAPFMGPYAASKFALEAVTDSLRRELLPDGIDVVSVQPGAIVTSIWDRVEEIDVDRYVGSRYEDRMWRVREQALRLGHAGLPPERVAEAVERALTVPRPPPRILVVDRTARRGLRLGSLLPTRVLDRLIARRMGG